MCHALQLAQPSSGAKSHSSCLWEVPAQSDTAAHSQRHRQTRQLGMGAKLEVVGPGKRKPLRSREPLHSLWVQKQKPKKLTGNFSLLSWELSHAHWCNLSLAQHRNHCTGEPAWRISGTLEKEVATLPASTFKPFQLILFLLHLTQNTFYNLFIFCRKPAQ